jgi:hypothetical protein
MGGSKISYLEGRILEPNYSFDRMSQAANLAENRMVGCNVRFWPPAPSILPRQRQIQSFMLPGCIERAGTGWRLRCIAAPRNHLNAVVGSKRSLPFFIESEM